MFDERELWDGRHSAHNTAPKEKTGRSDAHQFVAVIPRIYAYACVLDEEESFTTGAQVRRASTMDERKLFARARSHDALPARRAAMRALLNSIVTHAYKSAAAISRDPGTKRKGECHQSKSTRNAQPFAAHDMSSHESNTCEEMRAAQKETGFLPSPCDGDSLKYQHIWVWYKRQNMRLIIYRGCNERKVMRGNEREACPQNEKMYESSKLLVSCLYMFNGGE